MIVTSFNEKKFWYNFLAKVNKENIIIFLFSFFIVFAVNFRVLYSWFVWDDLACIFSAKILDFFSVFTKDYLIFNKMFYTPLLPLSFKLDHIFSFLQPHFYRIHNIIAASLAIFLGYNFSRLYLSKFNALLLSILFSLSLPIIFDVFWITRRHYLWGFNFVLVSIISFFSYLKFNKNFYLFLSLISAFISVLFKEAYFFVYPCLLFLAIREKRLSKVFPFILLLIVIYFLLRFYVLNFLGGYPGQKPSLSVYSFFMFHVDRLLETISILSGNLIVFLLFFLSLLVLFFRKKEWLFLFLFYMLISYSPFVFYYSSGFIFANKQLFIQLIFLLVIFAFIETLPFERKRIISVFVFIVIFLIYFSKSIELQERLIKISQKYKEISLLIDKEISKNKILFYGDASNHFALYTYLKHSKYIENFLGLNDLDFLLFFSNYKKYDTIIYANNFSLNNSLKEPIFSIIKDTNQIESFYRELSLREKNIVYPKLELKVISRKNVLVFLPFQKVSEEIIRCYKRLSYVGCYPLSLPYIFPYSDNECFELYFWKKNGQYLSYPFVFRRCKK